MSDYEQALGRLYRLKRRRIEDVLKKQATLDALINKASKMMCKKFEKESGRKATVPLWHFVSWRGFYIAHMDVLSGLFVIRLKCCVRLDGRIDMSWGSPAQSWGINKYRPALDRIIQEFDYTYSQMWAGSVLRPGSEVWVILGRDLYFDTIIQGIYPSEAQAHNYAHKCHEVIMLGTLSGINS